MADVNKQQMETAEEESKDTTTVIKPLSAIAHRMFHPPKLERKHSSGDLHSRLKTRKILGVGEIDNGDIHRSKISQLLGHNEHLYVKFPKGFQMWHLSMALLFTILGLMNLFFPEGSHDNPCGAEKELACRFYGCATLGISFFLWSFWGTMDKAVARAILMATAFCYLLQIIATLMSSNWTSLMNWRTLISLLVRILLLLPNVHFYRSMGFGGRMRKSNSFGNLRESGLNSSTQSK